MRAFVIDGPGRAAVREVEAPVARPGEVIVAVARAGVCGTDVELFTGDMAYLHQGQARYPLRPGHEWCGTVRALGDGVDAAWLGRRVTGDTMLPCHRCPRCATGRPYLCDDRAEIGIRAGWPGALAEALPVPATALHALPDAVDDVAGALVEPGANALRAALAAAPRPGARVLVLGPGTIGLLAAMFARSMGAEVHLLGRSDRSIDMARSLGFDGVWRRDELPDRRWDAVVDATSDPGMPAVAVDRVEAGGRVVTIGLSGAPSLVDTRSVTLKDVTMTGILSGSPAIDDAIARFASGAVDPRPLVAATVGLVSVAAVLGGGRPDGAGDGPKIHVDPRA